MASLTLTQLSTLESELMNARLHPVNNFHWCLQHRQNELNFLNQQLSYMAEHNIRGNMVMQGSTSMHFKARQHLLVEQTQLESLIQKMKSFQKFAEVDTDTEWTLNELSHMVVFIDMPRGCFKRHAKPYLHTTAWKEIWVENGKKWFKCNTGNDERGLFFLDGTQKVYYYISDSAPLPPLPPRKKLYKRRITPPPTTPKRAKESFLLRRLNDPPGLLIRGQVESLKSLRRKLEKSYQSSFKGISTSFYFKQIATNTAQPKEQFIIVIFTDEKQRELFKTSKLTTLEYFNCNFDEWNAS